MVIQIINITHIYALDLNAQWFSFLDFYFRQSRFRYIPIFYYILVLNPFSICLSEKIPYQFQYFFDKRN